MRWRRYERTGEHTFLFGVHPVIEALRRFPDQVVHLYTAAEPESGGLVEAATAAAALGIPVEVAPRAIRRLSPREDCRALAVMRKGGAALADDRTHVVLVEPANMGNLGTILRAMTGFGLDQLALVGSSADLWDPRVLRASMGTVFQVGAEPFDTFADYRRRFSRPTVALALDAPRELPGYRFPDPCSLLFGNEGAGLPGELLARDDVEAVRIPQATTVDSFNLAVAAGITFYAWSLGRG